MKTVKAFSLLLAFLMLISVFAACGNTPAETTGRPGGSSAGDFDDDRLEIEDTVPTDLNYAGETVTFLTRDNKEKYKYELACEELLNDTLYDAIHYRNIDVETRLGLKFRTLGRDGSYGNFALWNEALSISVLTNAGDYDGTAFYLSTGSSLAKEGIFYNLFELADYEGGYLNFEKPWWNQSMTEELAAYGALFFAGGSLTISQISDGVCVFFNRDLFNELYPDERDTTLYQLVRDGSWTADRMAAYISGAWTDINSNGVVDDGDIVGTRNHAMGNSAGVMDAWVVGMGLRFTETNIYGEPEIVLLNSNIIPAYEKVRNIFGNNPGALLTTEEAIETKMENGNVLFFTSSLNEGAEMRNSTVNFGVLPIPKYDAEQEDYYTCFGNESSAIAVCSNLSEDRAAMVSAVLELLSAESYKQVLPVYYGTVLKGHYSREQADAEMYDKILGSFVFSFGFAYSTHNLGAIGSIFRDLSPTFDMQNHIDSNKGTWSTKLSELLLALEAVS